MPRVSAAVPKDGDYYPTVRAWMVKLSATDLDQRANQTRVTRETARLYVSACLGPRFPLRFRRMRGAAGRGGASGITLDASNGTWFTLGTLLHEIAHARLSLRHREQREIRKKRIKASRTFRPLVKAVRPHGEEFCRAYAKLLREVLA